VYRHGINLSKVALLAPSKQRQIAQKIESLDPEKSALIAMMSNDGYTIFNASPTLFFPIFNGAGNEFRQTKLNISPSFDQWKKFSNDGALETTVRLIATDPRLERLQRSLVAGTFDNIKAQDAFWLGFLAVKFQKEDLALTYFTQALTKSETRPEKDKALFWKFLLTKNQKHLSDIIAGGDLNIYSLYAYEELHTPITNASASALDENITTPPSTMDMTDPFTWVAFQNSLKGATNEQILEQAKQFNTPELEQYRAILLERINQYKQHYFVSPFRSSLKPHDDHMKALILAIGRQESRFIPTALSSSYAIGVMQIMPFNIKSIASLKRENVTLTDLFDPIKNIDYATVLINDLQNKLGHPLFISYAYNGGLGFTKRMIEAGNFQEHSHTFEPFLSLELVPYAESREYGKKVLTNYVMYRAVFNGSLGKEPLSPTLHEMLKSLKPPFPRSSAQL
jgi:soluble lytic murein transglycosylase